jgi:tetratricopeptide (TPR) repeat protein
MGRLTTSILLAVSAYVPLAVASPSPADVVASLCSEQLPQTESQCYEYVRELTAKDLRTVAESIAAAESQLIFWERAENDDERAKFQSRARAYFEEALDMDPGNANAKFGLVVASPKNEQLQLLRNLIADHPTYGPGLQSLSRRIPWIDDSLLKDDLIATIESGYESSAGEDKWVTAGYLYRALRQSEDHDRATRFRSKVLADMGVVVEDNYGWDEKQNLRAACSYHAQIFDAYSECYMAITNASQSLAASNVSHDLMIEISSAISNLLPNRTVLLEGDPDALDALEQISRRIVERTFEKDVPALLVRSVFVEGAEKLSTLQKAAAIEGEYRSQALYWLGLALEADRDFERALEAYWQAIETGDAPYEGLARNEYDRLLATIETQ